MQRKRKLGRGVAVVGAGMSPFGMYPGKNSKDLFAEAFGELAVSVDKGLDPADIDALYLGNFTNDFFVHQAHWVAHVVQKLPQFRLGLSGSDRICLALLGQRSREGAAILQNALGLQLHDGGKHVTDSPQAIPHRSK